MAAPLDDRSAYLAQLAARLAELLQAMPAEEAEDWMRELAWEAEDRGWVESAHHLRRPAWVFARDLLVDNPAAFERLPFVGFELPAPEGIDELHTFSDLII